MTVPSIQRHLKTPQVDLPILAQLGKGLGESEENFYSGGRLNLRQGSPGVDGGHGGRHSLPPVSEYPRSSTPTQSSSHAMKHRPEGAIVFDWEDLLHKLCSDRGGGPPLPYPTLPDTRRGGNVLDVTVISPINCGLVGPGKLESAWPTQLDKIIYWEPTHLGLSCGSTPPSISQASCDITPDCQKLPTPWSWIQIHGERFPDPIFIYYHPCPSRIHTTGSVY